MPKLSRPAGLALLFLGAFLLRMGAVFYWGVIDHGPVGISSADEVQFNKLALHLSEGHGYRLTPEGPPSAFRAPGFPFLLAGVYWLWGENYPLVYTLFALLGAGTCVFTYFVARELLTEQGAWLAAIFTALYLPLIYWTTGFYSENVFIPLLLLGIWFFLKAEQSVSLSCLALSGLILGYATLTRPFGLLLLPLFGLLLLGGNWRRQNRWWAGGMIFGLTFLVPILPWTYRNHLVFGQTVLIATNGGSTFYGSNNDRVYFDNQAKGYWVSTKELPGRDLIEAQPDEVSHDKMEWKLGMDWVKNNLAKMPLLTLYKLARLWWIPEYGEGRRWLRFVSYVPFLALMVLGFFRLFRNGAYWTWPWWTLHLTMAATFITVILFSGQSRFRDANGPLLMIYAALGVQRRPTYP